MRRRWSRYSVSILVAMCVIVVALAVRPAFGQIQFQPVQVQPTLQLAPIRLMIQNLPLTLELKSEKPISRELATGLQSASAQVVEKFVLPRMAPAASQKAVSISAETSVLAEAPGGGKAETLVLLLLKDTFTAEPALATYDVVGGQAQNVQVTYPYAIKTPVRFVEPRLMATPQAQMDEKARQVMLKAVGVVPQDPAQFNYDAYLPQAEQAEKAQKHNSWWNAKALSNTACNTFPSAVNATNQIYSIFYYAGLPAARRIGPESTKSEINDFLYKDNYLLAWSNIGHGVTNASNGQPCYGLAQWGGTQWWNEFLSSSGWPAKGILWSVCFTNSCNSYMDPLKRSIKYHYPRTYIGGRILLPVNRSEWVDRDFWYRALLLRQPMSTALQTSSAAHGLVGAFGLDGYTGSF